MSYSETGFVISDSLHAAWDLFKEKWYVIYGLYLIPVVVAVVYSLTLNALGEEFGVMSLFVMFIYMILQTVVSMGVVQGYLNLVRGKEINVETFKSMLPLVVNYFLGTLLMGVIILAGLIFLIVPGIYFSLKYYFVPFLLIDKKMGPMEALKAS
ncbi:MAG: hypothetical protein CO041_05365, partial [Candidatus Pacebacteria bacterium CG_4_9_14_0_2_um_filter_40_15]